MMELHVVIYIHIYTYTHIHTQQLKVILYSLTGARCGDILPEDIKVAHLSHCWPQESARASKEQTTPGEASEDLPEEARST